jgi:hypothetical protein
LEILNGTAIQQAILASLLLLIPASTSLVLAYLHYRTRKLDNTNGLVARQLDELRNQVQRVSARLDVPDDPSDNRPHLT